MELYEKIFLSTFKQNIIFHNRTHHHFGFLPHWHEHIEILHFIDGTSTVYLNGVPISVSGGDILIVNPNVLHEMPVKLTNCTYHCLIINKAFADTILENQDFSCSPLLQAENITSLIDHIVNELSTKNTFYNSCSEAYTSLLLSTLARDFSPPEAKQPVIHNNAKMTMIKNCMAYISINYKEPLLVEDISSHLGYSKYYLCHTFKEITGNSIVDYLNIVRCTHIKQLITKQNFSIKDAAFSCGFHNLSYFTKTYKKHMGMLPSDDKHAYSASHSI